MSNYIESLNLNILNSIFITTISYFNATGTDGNFWPSNINNNIHASTINELLNRLR